MRCRHPVLFASVVAALFGLSLGCENGASDAADGGPMVSQDRRWIVGAGTRYAPPTVVRLEDGGLLPFDGGTPMPDVITPRIAAMTDDELVGQLLFVRYRSSCDDIAALMPGGIIYYGADVSDEVALRRDSLDLLACAEDSGMSVPPLITTNHEGGRVHYFDASARVTRFPAAWTQCATGPDYVRSVASAQARELHYAGLTMTLSPSADVLFEGSTVIGDRSFSSMTDLATTCVVGALDGFAAEDMPGVLKHFPGHGGVMADTHLGLATDHADLDAIRRDYLPPFLDDVTGGSRARYVMVSHVVFDEVDRYWPSSLSRPIIDLLGVRGAEDTVVMTDDLNMGAIVNNWGVAPAAARALMAGSDMLMIGGFTDALATHDLLRIALTDGLSLAMRNLAGDNDELRFTATEVRARVEEAVRRILAAKRDDGMLDHDVVDGLTAAPLPDYRAHAALSTDTDHCRIGAEGWIADDSAPCFERGGTPAYWREDGEGFFGTRLWTLSAAAPMADNYGLWRLSVTTAGTFHVCAYVKPLAGTAAEVERASYQVRHAGATSRQRIDQSGADGWTLVGTYDFGASDNQWIRLGDNTGETGKRIVFDAVAMVPDARSCTDLPSP